jgi:PAS domain S-box-containing protein
MFRGERDTCSLPLQSKDGRLLPVETRVFFGQWNGAACLFGVSRDLSAEQEAKQRFEKLFRYNPALMALRSMSDRRFVDANETFLKMMGYRQAEIIGKTSAELGLLPEPSDLAAEDALFATQGHVTGLELTVRSRDGSIRNGLFSGETIVIQGQSYVLIVMIDITQRKQAEAQLLAMNRQLEILTKQADDANRAKGVFLATMSHEIRTPMGGVLGMTGLLMRTALTDRQRHYTERIRTSGEALLSVIGDILDFSKIDSGMLQLDERIFSLKRDVLDRLWSIIGGPAEEKGLRVRVTSDEGLPLLLGDFRRLTQVLVNLLGNAVKFTEKGEVELSVRIREQDGERVSLSLVVRDTGIGIDQEQMTLLFKPFSQADPSTVRRYGGSGLGLTISKQIVELMGGEIAVESQPGRGSIFTVRLLLPVAPAIELAEREESASLADEEGVRFAGARVLLVEDQPINREIILELLRLDGIEADIAQDGREALDKVGGESYDLVLMDVQMPVMDGYAATREIRVKEAKTGARRLPIVTLTAHAIAGDREKVEAAGMDDYLTKPLDPEAFHLALLRWLPREKRMVATAHLTGPTGTEEGLSADADLPGLDVAEGVQRVKGNETLYHKLLRNFVEDFGDLPEQLPQDLRTNRMVDAIHRVHSVKGVSGNLGGNELMAAAGSLEKALREMNDHPHFSVDEHLRVFIDCHQEFLATVTAYLALNPELVPEAPEGPRGTPEELQPLLENLRAALAAEEPRPCKEILRSLAQRRWPESVEAILAELRGLSDRYRLAEAHALLEGKGGDLLGEFGNIGGKNG